MFRNFVCSAILFTAMQLACQSLFSQSISLIRKVGGEGRLSILIYKGDSAKRYYAGCFLKEVTLLSDTTKLRLIGDLFGYLDDTTMCYMPVKQIDNRYYTYGKGTPKSQKYNLQIDALILINYIAFSTEAFTYSPFPLLVDKKKKLEICCSGLQLEYVIKCYKRWFENVKKKGFKNYSFPIINANYEWFGSRNVDRTFVVYPQWSNFYDCPTLSLAD